MTGKLPKIFRRLFANEGAGPLLLEEIVPYPDRYKYNLCEFYFFRHPILKPGFQPAQGGLLENAAELYPEAWDYLQTADGRLLCKTEAEWQALTRSNWATLADGSTVGWNGIGGAPFYAPDTGNSALRLPDLRGMYAEAAGYDSLGVGGVHGDGMRSLTGLIMGLVQPAAAGGGGINMHGSGVFVTAPGHQAEIRNLSGYEVTHAGDTVSFSAAAQSPIAAKSQPRAWGALACVYLGAPK